MNVLSLFDGMSCGRIALDQLGIKVDNYYACEIDKYAMQVSQANYPEIIQLGDVCDVKSEDLPKIDLILAGSPCQGFSFAGKQLAFDDPRSALFFEFIRLLKECKPKYFLLENVRMKKEYLQVISEQVSGCYPEIPFGIEPTMICSSLVSAQSRKRYYWTNIPNVTQPKQKGIVLRDILETRVNQDRLSDMTNQDNKAYCLTTTYPCARPQRSMDKSEKSMIPVEDTVPDSTTLIYDSKDKSHSPIQVGIATDINGHDILKRVYSEDGKSPTVNTCQGGNREPKVLAGAYRARSIDKDGNRVSWKEVKPKQMLELRRDEKSNTVTSVQKDNVLTQDEVYWRKLTPLECERLQTVPDNYTNHVSNSQRFKMLGNGWTIEVIKHIFKNMERE
jgi:DNA (cytosine-5)-methyltransferase 3A